MILWLIRTSRTNLSRTKLHFAQLVLLGHAINDEGMEMDVRCILNWKVPANCNLAQDFIGFARYLVPVDETANVRIPMGLLNLLAQPEGKPFKSEWHNRIDDTRQPAFEEVKDPVCHMIKYCQVLPNCSKNVAATAQTPTNDVVEVFIRRTASERS